MGRKSGSVGLDNESSAVWNGGGKWSRVRRFIDSHYIHFCRRPGRMAAPCKVFVWPFFYSRIIFTLFLSPVDCVITRILLALMFRHRATDHQPQSLLWPPRQNGSARRPFRVALFLFLDNIHLVFVTHILLTLMSRRRTTDRNPKSFHLNISYLFRRNLHDYVALYFL